MKKKKESIYEAIPLGQRFKVCRIEGCGDPGAWVCKTTVWVGGVYDYRCDQHHMSDENKEVKWLISSIPSKPLRNKDGV